MTEINVGVRELRTHLSQYLREVKNGKTIVITDHGKPVGRLIPTILSVEDRLEAARNAGIITWNGRKPQPAASMAKGHGPGAIAQLLIEDRE